MCATGVTTPTPSIVDNSYVESSVKSESRNKYVFLYLEGPGSNIIL